MTNVLPPQEKKRLWSFYRGRFVLTGSFAISAAAVVTLLGLAPTYYALMQNRAIVEAALAAGNEGAQEERAEAFKTQAFLKEMKPYVIDSRSPMSAIEDALRVRPTGISVQRISYTNEAKFRLVLTGSAQSRESINAYRKALESTGAYTSVTVPVSDLVGGTGRFTLTLVSK